VNRYNQHVWERKRDKIQSHNKKTEEIKKNAKEEALTIIQHDLALKIKGVLLDKHPEFMTVSENEISDFKNEIETN
jgi:hypothetical protein